MTTSTSTATSPARTSRGRLARAGGIALAAALAGNLALFAVGRTAELDFAIRPAGGGATTVTAASVVIVTVLALALGTALAAVLGRLPRPGLAVATVGGAIMLLSLAAPLSAEAANGTKILLTAMHLVTGAAYIWFVGRASARRP
jgi:hypothetical protein